MVTLEQAKISLEKIFNCLINIFAIAENRAETSSENTEESQFFTSLIPRCKNSTSFLELLAAVYEIERLIYAKINKVVLRIQVETNSQTEAPEREVYAAHIALFSQVQPFIEILRDINKILLHIPHESLFTDDTRDILREINQDLTAFKGESREFLSNMRAIVILSLAKACLIPPGRKLVHKLLERKKRCAWIKSPLIHLSLRFDIVPSSFVTEIAGRGNAFAALEPWAERKLAKMPDTFKRLNKRDDIGQHGTASLIQCPIWSDTPDEVLYENLIGHQSLNTYDIDILTDRLLLGSFSLTQENQVFYCPLHLEIVHEVIHVLHNLCGTNRARLTFPDVNHQALSLAHLWKNAEEYWTIQGGKLTENSFNHEMGMPLRYGHNGMAVCRLIPKFNSAAYIHPRPSTCSVS